MRRRLFALGLSFVLLACAGSEEQRAAACRAGSRCVVEGTLTLLRGVPGSVGVIRGPGWCVALALDPAVYVDIDKWDEKYVRVAGPAFEQPAAPGLYWYDLDGRVVSLGACDRRPVIYVETIELLAP